MQTLFKGLVEVPLYTFEIHFCGYQFYFGSNPSFNFNENAFSIVIGRDVLFKGNLHYQGEEGNWSFVIPGLSPK